MNIVDVIKSQLSGDVLGKLRLAGRRERRQDQGCRRGRGARACFAVLASLASTSGGADKVINALKQVDTGSGGGLR